MRLLQFLAPAMDANPAGPISKPAGHHLNPYLTLPRKQLSTKRYVKMLNNDCVLD